MIRILERHIAKTIITATGLVALIIVGVLFVMTLLGELRDVGEGDYFFVQAVFYVLLRLPNQVYQFSPMLVLIGSMVGLSTLATHRELAVMRASGFSIKRIIVSVLMAAFVLVLIVSVVGEWVAPRLSYQAEMRKENLQNGGQSVVTGSGIWFHVDHNFIHVQRVMGRQLLEGVTRYQFDQQHRLKAAYFAKQLILENNQWVMKQVVKTNFYQERTKSTVLPQAVWDLKFNPNLLNVGLVEPSELSLPKLVKFARYLERNGLQAAQYRFDFWQRIFQPFASLVMILLAIPFVLGAMGRSTLGWRIIVGVMLGFVFFIANAFLGQLSIVYQVPPVLAAALPLLFFLVIGLLLSWGLIKQ